jgi:hypothetical protein
MATRELIIFVTESEYFQVVKDLVEELHLFCVSSHGGSTPNFRVVDNFEQRFSELSESGVWKLYVTQKLPEVGSLNNRTVNPAKLGLIDLGFPRSESNELHQIQLGVRTDWYNRETGKIVEETGDLLKVFGKIKYRFSKILHSPMWISDSKQIIWRKENILHFSNGAKEFELAGGRLVQAGVKNVVFSCIQH